MTWPDPSQHTLSRPRAYKNHLGEQPYCVPGTVLCTLDLSSHLILKTILGVGSIAFCMGIKPRLREVKSLP